MYAYLGHAVSLKDNRLENDLMQISAFGARLSQLTAFILPELSSLDENYIKELMEDEEFKDHKRTFEAILIEREHVLSEAEETALATASAYNDGFSEVYDTLMDTDLKYDSFVVDGKEYSMSEEKYSLYMNDKNREVREKAYKSLYAQYKKYANTFAKLLSYHIKSGDSDLKLRKYESYLSATLEGSKIPKEVYYKLIEKVDENVNVMKEYFSLLKKETGIEDFNFYDTYVTISTLDKKYDHETQFKIIKEALAPLGGEYQDILEEAYENNWMDVYPSDTKSSGGYQTGSYDTHPYVLLNNTDTYSSMSTQAHELGHAIHSYYSNKCQPWATSQYEIYVAEVASTVNEILLNRYMFENAESYEDKIFFIDKYIKNIKATVFRQTMFSEFEEKLHYLSEQDIPLTLDTINEEYYKVLDKHFSGVVNIDENINHEWIRISHFYRPFYVYKYATSYTCANYIATCILENKNNMKEKYLELLKSGCKDWPNEILKNVGVDLASDEPYDILFNDLKNAIEEMKGLLEQRHKNDKKSCKKR